MSAPALADPLLPTLGAALDPAMATAAFASECPELAHRPPIQAIEVRRHRPGRRCLVRYTFADGTPAILGKITAKGVHQRSLAVQARLHEAGFASGNGQAIAVPEPLGAVPSLGLWLQREVPGRPLQAMLGEPAAITACDSSAQALAKLHRQPAGDARPWTIVDELAVLAERWPRLQTARPDLGHRARRLYQRCRAAAGRLPETPACGIHRDFYPEQLLVADKRLHLLDFDLYARGDPALDAGNFIAHLIEAAIRETGDAQGYAPLVGTFRARFLAQSPAVTAEAVDIHTLLSLARLVQISTAMPERRAATSAILDAAEAMAHARA